MPKIQPPSEFASPIVLAARILHEMAIAADAASATITLSFVKEYTHKGGAGPNTRGLAVQIDCGRVNTILCGLEPPYWDRFPNTLPHVFEALAKLMTRAGESGDPVLAELKSLLGIGDEEL